MHQIDVVNEATVKLTGQTLWLNNLFVASAVVVVGGERSDSSSKDKGVDIHEVNWCPPDSHHLVSDALSNKGDPRTIEISRHEKSPLLTYPDEWSSPSLSCSDRR